MIEKDVDLSLPFGVYLNSNIYELRRNEGIVELRGGRCPYFKLSGLEKKGCNHCSLPIYSSEKKVSTDLLKKQIDNSFVELRNISGSENIKSLSMYNGGSAFDSSEISREALFYLFSEAVKYRDKNVFPKLNRISVESRESFVEDGLLEKSVKILEDITLEVGFGLESVNDRIRNGDVDNYRGLIGLNKGISIKDFEEAVDIVSGVGAQCKFYVMMQPVPWLSKKESIIDVVNTVGYLHNISQSKNMPTFIHLNPMYAAKGSVLYDVWQNAFLEGKSLPDWQEVVDSLEVIDSNVAKLNSDEIYIYLGLDSEGLGENENRFNKRELIQFNKDQRLGTLIFLRNIFRNENDYR